MPAPIRTALALLGMAVVLSCREAGTSTAGAPATQSASLAGGEPAAAATLASYRLTGAPAWRVALPEPLREVSGLAVTADGRLFAHGDEEGTIHQVDPRAGTLIKSFTLAPGDGTVDLGKKQKKGPLAGDFEDLAIVGDRFYLVTSNGMLVEFAEGANGAEVPVTIHRTALGETCEIEGLEHDADGNALLLLCKTMRSKAEREQVAVYAWSLAERTLEPTPRLTAPWGSLAPATGGRAFNASALALIPGGRSLALVAGPQRLYAEVTSGGAAVTGGALRRDLHPQPEGVAFLPDGTLLLSSEGGNGDASLSGYPPQ